jgi:hypothetical protein
MLTGAQDDSWERTAGTWSPTPFVPDRIARTTLSKKKRSHEPLKQGNQAQGQTTCYLETNTDGRSKQVEMGKRELHGNCRRADEHLLGSSQGPGRAPPGGERPHTRSHGPRSCSPHASNQERAGSAPLRPTRHRRSWAQPGADWAAGGTAQRARTTLECRRW